MNNIHIKLIAIACFLSATSSFSQEISSGRDTRNYNNWSIGLNVGNVFTLAEASSFEGKNNKTSIGTAAYVTKHFSSVIGLRLELGAGTTSGSNLAENTNFKGDYRYLSSLLQFNLSNLSLKGRLKDRKFGLYLDFGPGINQFHASKFSEFGNLIAKMGDPEGSSISGWMLTGGLSGKFRLTEKVSLEFGSRYNTFQSNTNDFFDAHVSTGPENDVRDAFFYSFIGLSFNLGDKQKSVEWTNPLDELNVEVKEVSEKIKNMSNDMDQDGVVDAFDDDNYTPEGVFVDSKGKPRDVDNDGIPDHLDLEPFSAPGVQVDENGKELDSDGDGVVDSKDAEPGTPSGTLVNFQGISISNVGGNSSSTTMNVISNAYLPSIYFDFGQASIKYANYERLSVIAKVLKNNPDVKLKVIGNTDQKGSSQSNLKLGERRAQAIADHLVKFYNINSKRLIVESKGELEPLTDKIDQVNRRVDFMIIPLQ